MDEMVATADGLLAALEVDVVEAARVTESKSVRYIIASGTKKGDAQAVVGELSGALAEHGWVVLDPQRGDVSRSPATIGEWLVARNEGLFVRVAVFDQVGSNRPPAGWLWVQLALSEQDDRLDWTRH